MAEVKVVNELPVDPAITHVIGHDSAGLFKRAVVAKIATTGKSTDAANEINVQTGTTYTIQATDNNKLLRFANTGTITVTLPATLPAGFACGLIQWGSGQIKLVGAPGAELRNADGHNGSRALYSQIGVSVADNTAGNAANWALAGDTATVA